MPTPLFLHVPYGRNGPQTLTVEHLNGSSAAEVMFPTHRLGRRNHRSPSPA
jgi:hypothetical protein